MRADHLAVRVYEDRERMGAAAAFFVGDLLRTILSAQEVANVIFAAAPSQNEFLAALVGDLSIDWSRVNGFHMDEYIGLEPSAPQLFSRFLRERLFDLVAFREMFYIDSQADPSLECFRYSELLRRYPPDLVCMGVGENAHIAFNDPPVADFHDPFLVKTVLLDEVCRQQQVNDGCFVSLRDVPVQAITLTIPALMSARFVSCVVPGVRKRSAVSAMLGAPVSEAVPASILRTHPNAVLFVDKDSYNL